MTKLDLCAVRESKPNFYSGRNDKMIEVCYFPPEGTADQVFYFSRFFLFLYMNNYLITYE